MVSDAPEGSSAAKLALDEEGLPSYDELLLQFAEKTDGFTGASLAGVARAASSHALERAVQEFSQRGGSLLDECVVTMDDFEEALKDLGSIGDTDYSDD